MWGKGWSGERLCGDASPATLSCALHPRRKWPFGKGLGVQRGELPARDVGNGKVDSPAEQAYHGSSASLTQIGPPHRRLVSSTQREMPGSRWTLMLVPHDNERVRSFQVAWKDVRAVVSAILLVVFLLGTFTVAFFVKQSQHVRAGSLRRENELLAPEVTQMRAEMEHLNQSIETLGQKDEQYRVMSGLNALTSDPRTGTTRSVSEQA